MHYYVSYWMIAFNLGLNSMSPPNLTTILEIRKLPKSQHHLYIAFTELSIHEHLIKARHFALFFYIENGPLVKSYISLQIKGTVEEKKEILLSYPLPTQRQHYLSPTVTYMENPESKCVYCV